MLCPKCSSPNSAGAKECEVCGVIFAHAKRGEPVKQIALCAWMDQGRPCPCRGILSESQNGGGSWYCREHWERLHRREPYGAGNAFAPSHPRSIAAQKWREEWRAKFGDRKVVQDKPMPNPLEAA